MGKTSTWLRNIFTGKKSKEKSGDSNPDWNTEKRFASVPAVAAAKEKRWSFRRSVGATKEFNSNSAEQSLSEACGHGLMEFEIDQKRRAMAVAAHAAAAVVRLTATVNDRTNRAMEEASAIKIQSFFRSYLARKALNALKGLVKMQALVRGHLVRKQANATLRCMQALVKAQDRARAERIRMVEASQSTPLKHQNYRRSPRHHPFEPDYNEEEYVKIVEMDLGGRSYSLKESDNRFCNYNSSSRTPSKADLPAQLSPVPSALTEMSPRVYSMNFEEIYIPTVQNSPQLSAMSMPPHTSYDHPLYPNYMANTESSRAKLRSQSAPKQRLDTNERQSSKRRQSVEGRNVAGGVRMQRSSSHVGMAGNIYEFPWYMKLDKSNMSFIESECGSTSTVLTNKNYCRSPAGYEWFGLLFIIADQWECLMADSFMACSDISSDISNSYDFLEIRRRKKCFSEVKIFQELVI
ncbi:uncharacterized protein LOC110028489 [Phalaenopsis equestris]|uniref:uncharacterized protein LOC110028489 n=1 Tax=Phalaenopsis equestris TaxID=78828 RepID=UPI0009E27268|nr:uncharacterized protein LOC110028489 [Phalaenopsis equestris]